MSCITGSPWIPERYINPQGEQCLGDQSPFMCLMVILPKIKGLIGFVRHHPTWTELLGRI